MARFVLTQTAFAAGELSPRVLGRTDMDRYAYGLKRCRNAHPVLHGGVKRRPGTLWVGEALTDLADTSILIPFVQGRDASWMLEFGDLQVRIRTTAGTVVTTLTSPYTAANLPKIDWTQSDSEIWIFHPDVPVHRLQRLGSGTWVIAPAEFTTEPFAEVGIRPAFSATLSASTVGVGRTLTAAGASFLASDVGRGVIFDAGLAVITGYTSATVVTVEITRAFPGVVLTANDWVIDISPQTDCLPSAVGPVGAIITLTLSADGWRSTDVGAIVRINGGLCKITGYTSATIVSARVLRELTAAVAAPALSWSLEHSVWSAQLGYPRTGTIYQQRLIAAGTEKYPRTVWGSRVGELLDFERWTNDSDSFAFTIDSDDATAITYVTASQELAVLTESGEYSMRGGVEKPITPTNVRVRQESTHGCAQVRPVQINRETMFVQRAGRKVRAFGYRYDFDGFSAPDVAALAEHITFSGVVSMAWSQEAEQVLWSVRADGRFLSCTVDRDQQPSVIAWALHETDGHVECMASIPFEDRDVVWVIVRRLVDGDTKRFIERLEDKFEPWHSSVPDPADGSPRPVYGCTVDSARIFDNGAGAPQSEFDMPHLVGEEVDVIADGSYMGRKTVPEDGIVTIERTAKRALVGLPFRSEVVLLTPEAQTGAGSAQGQAARTGESFIRLLETIGAKVRNNQGNEETVPFRTFGVDVLDQPPKPFTGAVRVNLLGWERGESEVAVIQEQPFPMHVLAWVRTHQTGGA